MTDSGTSQTSFTRFIIEHENDDPAKLLLSRDKWEGLDIDLAVNTILSRRKLRDKVPAWYAEPGLVFPAKVSAEQCSSQDTAFYKADLALRLARETGKERPEIADLTGGFGVDSWAFSHIAEKVFYNEMNPALAEAARHNFAILGARNISVSCKTLEPGSVKEVLSIETPHSVEAFSPDIIYLDPGRRDGAGRKVFRIEDCQPDIGLLRTELLGISRFLMVKLSPMMDISLAALEFGNQCREIHIVSSGGECKELLVVVDREFCGEYRTVVIPDAKTASDNRERFEFTTVDEIHSPGVHIHEENEIINARYLFEPGKSLMKSGAFNLIADRFGIKKLSRSTHLYFFSDDEKIPALKAFGKVFRIIRVLPMNGKGIRQAGAEFPEAEVTAKNIKMSSETLRKKLGTRPSDRYHIFGAEYLFVTERMIF